MGWQPGNDGRRSRPGWLVLLWIAVVALALAGCSKGKAEGTAASPAGLPVYKASVQKFK
jgi:multidrug efflux pump subunit AcrA (membrane-fusion protein)